MKVNSRIQKITRKHIQQNNQIIAKHEAVLADHNYEDLHLRSLIYALANRLGISREALKIEATGEFINLLDAPSNVKEVA